MTVCFFCFFFSSRRRHTRFKCDWSSDVCSSDLNRNSERRYPRCSELLCPRLEATAGLEPAIGVLQTPALTSWPRRLSWSGRRDSNPRPPPWQGGALPLSHFRSCPFWCRGGDLNPYALTGTAPSRRRVYLFHHLGSMDYVTDYLEGPATIAFPCARKPFALIPAISSSLLSVAMPASPAYAAIASDEAKAPMNALGFSAPSEGDA